MNIPWEIEIRHFNDRRIASQLRPLHGKLRFFPENRSLASETCNPAGRPGHRLAALHVTAQSAKQARRPA
ncbi:hypothetical protein [Bradyrhizobium sp. UFLA05-112]